MKRGTLAVLVACLGLAGCGGDSPSAGPSPAPTGTAPPASPSSRPDTPAATDDRVGLTAMLTGAAVAPGPGDPDGSGVAQVTIDLAASEVCVELTVTGIAGATGAHIHEGTAGTAGPVVVTLGSPVGGESSGCVADEPVVIGRIADNPDGFYIDVHTAALPDGALRGQLVA